MSAKKFKFVSPGIFIKEIDNSQLPKSPVGVGPVVIGRSERGPAMRPVRVESFSEFVEMFGNPIPGGRGDDVFRDGNYLAPTYAAYAAQAWLKSQSPLTFCRLLGVDHQDSTGVKAGWVLENAAQRIGAYGLFIADAPDAAEQASAEADLSSLSAGDTVILGDEATGLGANITLTESSATRRAAIIRVASAANLNGGGANDETLILSLGAEGSRTYQIGDGAGVPNSQGVTVNGQDGLVTVAGDTEANVAARLAAYINDVDGEIFEAYRLPNGGNLTDVVIVAKARGNANDLTIDIADTGLGGLVGLQLLNNAGVAVRDCTTGGAPTASDSSLSCIALSSACQTPEESIDADDAGAATSGAEADHASAFIAGAAQDEGSASTNISLRVAMEGGDSIEQQAMDAFNGEADASTAVTLSIDSGAPGILKATVDAAGVNTNDAFNVAGAVTAFDGGSEQGGDFGNAALAAIIYNNGGEDESHLRLVGETVLDTTGAPVQAGGAFVKSVGGDYEFKLEVLNAQNGTAEIVKESVNFNFNPSSNKYIRKVLNTNPTLVNGEMTGHVKADGVTTDSGSLKSYWLGESFDRHLVETLGKNGPLQTTQGVDVDPADYATQVAAGRLRPKGAAAAAAGAQVACLVELGSGAILSHDHQEEARAPRSGWVFSQHMGRPENFLQAADNGEYSETQKLFRLHGLYSGEWDQKNLKISIEDIKPSGNPSVYPYGTFTLSVRRANDTDKNPVFLERYTKVSLDPNSPDYLAARLGDMETFWEESSRRYRTIGQYDNKSQFLRVEMNPDLEAGLLDPTLLPFGFYGPPQLADCRAVMSDNIYVQSPETGEAGLTASTANRTVLSHVQGTTGDNMQGMIADNDNSFADAQPDGIANYTSSLIFDAAAGSSTNLRFPKMKLRQNTRDGRVSRPGDCYWGIEQMRKGSSVLSDPGYGDYVASLGSSVGDADTLAQDGVAIVHPQFAFSLDDVQMENAQATKLESSADVWKLDGSPTSATHAEYLPENHDGQGGDATARLARGGAGARRMGSSLSANTDADGEPQNTYKDTLDAGFDRFSMPLFGGQDGLDLREMEPFRNSLLGSSGGELGHYAYNSIKRAIDACADPEVVECNIITAPGVTDSTLTDHMIDVCEKRADALAIIDLPGDYRPRTESRDVESSRLPNVSETILSLKDRVVNSSYGCAYFPWVQVRDQINNALVWVPPSVVALGAMANSETKTALWFAPAGFTRGGLSSGAAGLPVTNVRHRLNSDERDALYEANINPIAQFPAEGIVIFGQKTLQVEASALDRINVRRLMIYLKKEISRMAATVLFDQNVTATWGRFTSKVNPFLQTVKSQFGLSEYRVILDETTTTPDLIDRNIMYAKIMLKPTRAIEFIAIDFVITDSGASFDD